MVDGYLLRPAAELAAVAAAVPNAVTGPEFAGNPAAAVFFLVVFVADVVVAVDVVGVVDVDDDVALVVGVVVVVVDVVVVVATVPVMECPPPDPVPRAVDIAAP